MTGEVRRSRRLINKTILPFELSTNRISKKQAKARRGTDIAALKMEISKTSNEERETTEIIVLSQGGHLDNAIEHIKKSDPKLGSLVDEKALANLRRRFRKKVENTDVFRALLSSIFYQQIHGKAAEAIYGRFLKLFDGIFPTPNQVLQVSIEDLRLVGLSARKIEYVRDLAGKMADGAITPEKFCFMSPQSISTQLCSVKGIGQWTADMFLMNDLHHSDVLPLDDLAVRKGIAQHFGIKMYNDKSSKKKTHSELTEKSEIWRPYRTIGSVLMWIIADTKTVKDKKDD